MPRILAFLALAAWLILLFPYPTTIFLAACVACLTRPLFRWLRARMSRPAAVAAYVFGLITCLAIPFIVVTIMIAPQIMRGLRQIDQWRTSGWVISPELEHYIDLAQEWLGKIPGFNEWFTEISTHVGEMGETFLRSLVSGSIGIAGSTVSAAWLVVLFVIFSTLAVVYAPTLAKVTLRVTRLPEDSLKRFVAALRSALRAVFVGMLFVALAQGILCGIGFAITGVSEPAFWGLLAVFAAVVPVVGTALVWIPLALLLWFSNAHYAAIGLVLWCIILVAGSDNLIRPYMLKTGIQAPLAVLLISILCGISVLGPVGLIAGPVLVAFGIQAMRESDRLLEHAQC